LGFMVEMNKPGLEVVGPLPPQISTPVNLMAFMSSHAKNPDAAKAYRYEGQRAYRGFTAVGKTLADVKEFPC